MIEQKGRVRTITVTPCGEVVTELLRRLPGIVVRLKEAQECLNRDRSTAGMRALLQTMNAIRELEQIQAELNRSD